MIWFLDTNIVISCLRGRSPEALRRIGDTPPSQICIPMQTLAELLVGVEKSANPARERERISLFLSPFRVAWPDSRTVTDYAEIRAALERDGISISEADLWIAAMVRGAGGTLVTSNTREFSRVSGLRIEDWAMVR